MIICILFLVGQVACSSRRDRNALAKRIKVLEEFLIKNSSRREITSIYTYITKRNLTDADTISSGAEVILVNTAKHEGEIGTVGSYIPENRRWYVTLRNGKLFSVKEDDLGVPDMLGKGCSGNVYKMKKNQGSDEDVVAVKYVKKGEFCTKERFLKMLKEETTIGKQIPESHPALCPVYDYYWTPGQEGAYIIMPYFNCVTLKEIAGTKRCKKLGDNNACRKSGLPYIVDNKNKCILRSPCTLGDGVCSTSDDTAVHELQNSLLSVLQICRIMAQVADGLAYLHSIGVIHNDISPSNILVERYGDLGQFKRVRLFDYGQSKQTRVGNRSTNCGAIKYRAPEKCREHAYTNKVDCFAFGCTLYEVMLQEIIPSDGDSPTLDVMKFRLKKFKGNNPSYKPLVELVDALLDGDWVKNYGEDRPSMPQVLTTLNNIAMAEMESKQQGGSSADGAIELYQPKSHPVLEGIVSRQTDRFAFNTWHTMRYEIDTRDLTLQYFVHEKVKLLEADLEDKKKKSKRFIDLKNATISYCAEKDKKHVLQIQGTWGRKSMSRYFDCRSDRAAKFLDDLLEAGKTYNRELQSGPTKDFSSWETAIQEVKQQIANEKKE